MIYWPKRRSVPNPLSLQEIVITTIRNRMNRYYINGYNIDNPEYATDLILRNYYDRYKGRRLTSDEIVKALSFSIKIYEHNLWSASQDSKQEYGM